MATKAKISNLKVDFKGDISRITLHLEIEILLQIHKSKAYLGNLSWREPHGVSLKQMCMCAGEEQCIMGVKCLTF